ncbi:carboxypeptidase-like regulatory domain-containing protein [Lutibacter sp.]|uniref:carboxypeptidase-like regulatory domain-containing protein n=1 Tax=Lutibacter sp. TaxID=1925666 RepID=UPI001A284D8F|nr:carboxypeptidase-like regulatory domain-containing protein [Lutibacter sp.]MBI9041053.1 carboxypeptidase regulatory-like domain-containing protein [Lutibacter sp.]
MKYFALLLTFFSTFLIHSQSFKVDSFFSETQQTGTIKGVILDKENNNEPLVFAEIIVKNSAYKIETKIDGSFQFNLKPGVYNLEVRFIGYKTIEIKNVEVTSNAVINLNQSLTALKVDPLISIVSLR